MAKNWYPVIDILSCMECGTCVNFCPHGVYDKEKSPVPVVVNPDGCIDHCHGCQRKCPAGAIAYVGDTGDQPNAAPACCCHAEPETAKGHPLRIEYLYLDLTTCDRCMGTDAVLDEVVAVLRPALELAGYAVEYQKREMATPELAAQYRFLSSPTILVNGQDIFGAVQESSCGCCGEIAGTEVDCRVFAYEGKVYEVPTKEMLANAILKSLHIEEIDAKIHAENQFYGNPDQSFPYYLIGFLQSGKGLLVMFYRNRGPERLLPM